MKGKKLPLYLVRDNPKGQAPEPKIYNLDTNPCPTIMAGGVAGDNTSHYWLQYAESKQEIIRQIKKECVE